MEYDLQTDLARAKELTTQQYGNNTNVISSASLRPQPTIQPVTPTPDTTNYAGITGGITQSIMDSYKAYNDAQIAARSSQQSTGQGILDAMKKLQGKAGDTATANESAGVNTETANLTKYAQQLADLNAQASSLNREAQAIPLLTQERNRNTGATDAGVAPQNAGDLRLNALKALSIGQQSDIAAAAATGSALRLEAAKDKAQQIIDLKYKPIEDEIALKQKQYDLNKDTLTAIDAKRTEALGVALKKEAEDLAELKVKQKDNTSLALSIGINTTFANKNGEFFRTSDGKPYGDIKEFFKDAGVSSFEEAYQRGLITDISAETIADKNFVITARANYPDAGINFNDTPEDAAWKVKNNSFKYGKETHIEDKTSGGIGTVRLKGPDGVEMDYFVGENGRLVPAVGGDVVQNTTLSDKETKALAATTETKALKSLADLKVAITDYDKLIKQEGFALSGAGKTKLDQAYATVKILWKEAANLGALTGPDVELITEAIPKATGFAALNPFGPNVKGVREVLGNAVNIIDRNARGKYDQLTLLNDKYGDNPYVQSLGKPFGLAPVATDQSSANFVGPTQNQVKGWNSGDGKLPLLNMDGSEKTPNIPITKAYPQGTYPAGKPNSLANQCGYFVRSIVEKQGLTYPTVGDTLSSKMATVKRYGTSGGVGKVLITNENKKSGHVAYIIGKTAKGWILGESNYGLDGKINYGREIPFNSPSIIGYLQPKRTA